MFVFRLHTENKNKCNIFMPRRKKVQALLSWNKKSFRRPTVVYKDQSKKIIIIIKIKKNF